MADCEGLIKALSITLGIDLSFSDDGTCGVTFDNDEIIFEKYEKSLYLISVIGSVSGHSDLYRKLLEANYLGQNTENAIISIDANRDEFILHRVIRENIEYGEFEQILTSFVKVTRHWKRFLISPEQGKETLDPKKSDFKLSDLSGIPV